MANFQSKQVTNKVPVPSANAATDLIPVVGDWAVPASGLLTGDVIEMCALPAGYVPVDVILDHENLGTAFTAAVGIMSGNYGASGVRTCGAEFIAAATMQALGIKRMNVGLAGMVAPTTNDRSVGLVISGTLTSPVAAAKARLTVLCRPQSEGV